MNIHPARYRSVLAASSTATADEYGLPRYQRLMPAPEQAEAQANQLARFFTVTSQEKLASLLLLPEDWDGNGSLKPAETAVANASARLPELYRLTTVRGVWREPLVGASEAGEVTFEWWSGPRKVTMYFGPQSVEVIRVWGVNINTEMEHQLMPTLDAFPAVWAWLYGN